MKTCRVCGLLLTYPGHETKASIDIGGDNSDNVFVIPVYTCPFIEEDKFVILQPGSYYHPTIDDALAKLLNK